MVYKIQLKVNGREQTHEVEPRLLLVHYLRDVVGLTGTHIGCETSICGTCTVLVDGKAVKSCTLLAAQADGAEIITIGGSPSEGRVSLCAGLYRSTRLGRLRQMPADGCKMGVS